MDPTKDQDLGTRILPDPEVLSNPEQQEADKKIDLDPGPQTPAGQETPGKQAAAAALGEPTAGHKADGNPRTGPAIPGRESDTANPTWSQNSISHGSLLFTFSFLHFLVLFLFLFRSAGSNLGHFAGRSFIGHFSPLWQETSVVLFSLQKFRLFLILFSRWPSSTP